MWNTRLLAGLRSRSDALFMVKSAMRDEVIRLNLELPRGQSSRRCNRMETIDSLEDSVGPMNTLIKAGDKVRIRSIKERGQQETGSRQGQLGTVLARRVVDGSGVGYVVEFEDGSTKWFFEKELETA